MPSAISNMAVVNIWLEKESYAIHLKSPVKVKILAYNWINKRSLEKTRGMV